MMGKVRKMRALIRDLNKTYDDPQVAETLGSVCLFLCNSSFLDFFLM